MELFKNLSKCDLGVFLISTQENIWVFDKENDSMDGNNIGSTQLEQKFLPWKRFLSSTLTIFFVESTNTPSNIIVINNIYLELEYMEPN